MGYKQRTKRIFPRQYCFAEPVTCSQLNERGQCVVVINQKVYQIDELLANETARVVIYYEERKVGHGRAVELLKTSPDRALPLGHPKLKIGTYQLAHLTDEAQDAFKNAQVQKLFGSAAQPIIVGKRTYYRNKVVLVDGGFHAAGQGRKAIVRPKREDYDLMDIDFAKYAKVPGDLIIRRLDSEIVGAPGTNLQTTHHFLGKVFDVSLDAFYQVNSEMAALAYADIKRHILPNALVYDLYAGAATIAICVADVAKAVVAVEINPNAHANALTNIKLNAVTNVNAILADAKQYLAGLKNAPEVIIVDPPRAGLGTDFATVINHSKAQRIIYLSCNIETQHLDLKLLTNYRVTYMQPYDFFPQTYHIENLAILDKKPFA